MWSRHQAAFQARDIRRRIGDGWRYMTPETRAAFADAHIMGIVLGQHADTVEREAIRDLRAKVHHALGLADADGCATF